jgi:hypothetical protein
LPTILTSSNLLLLRRIKAAAARLLFTLPSKKMKFFSQLLILVLLMLLHSAIPKAQTQPEQFWQPTDQYRIEIDAGNSEVRALMRRWDDIGEELKSTKNPFAGTYEKRSYRGWLLRWAPKSGFVYIYHSEGLSIIDFSFGKARVNSGEILFEPERKMKETFDGKRLTTPVKWVPIESTVGVYLIAEQEMKRFGDYVGGFGEHNDFNGPCCDFDPFFFRPREVQTSQPKATSLVLPSAYESLITPPIKGRIVYVGQKRFVRNYSLEGKLYSQLFLSASLTPIVLNVGTRQGVRKNRLFRLVGEPGQQYLKIVSVSRERSSGVVIRERDDNGRETYLRDMPGESEPRKMSFTPIHPGIKVTTSPILDF